MENIDMKPWLKFINYKVSLFILGGEFILF